MDQAFKGTVVVQNFTQAVACATETISGDFLFGIGKEIELSHRELPESRRPARDLNDEEKRTKMIERVTGLELELCA
jgi:hypothetical protein